MTTQHVTTAFTHGGKIRVVTLSRPDKRNAITPAMFDALIEAFGQAPTPDECATVIRGAGDVFSSGVDLGERLRNGWPEKSPLVELCDAVRTYPLPVVTAVHGHAIAGGAMLALHGDLIVAAETATFSVPLVRLGLAAPWILCSRLVSRVGPGIGRDILLLGAAVPATRLWEANALNAIAPAADYEASLERVVNRLAENAPLSLRAHKAALTLIGEAGPHRDVQAEEELVRIALDSQDAKEGMAAQLEKRAPQFTGH
jgi:enoyl-CoA hydratase/carnithine racemase